MVLTLWFALVFYTCTHPIKTRLLDSPGQHLEEGWGLQVSPCLRVLSLKQADGSTLCTTWHAGHNPEGCRHTGQSNSPESPAKWHFSPFVCRRKDYTPEWRRRADIFSAVTLEKHREFFNHLEVILSERIEIIQFGPNLPERKAETITTIDFSPLRTQIHCQKY